MSVTIIDRLLSFRKQWAGRRFDRRHGVETVAMLDRHELTGMPVEIRQHAGAYVPTNPSLFRRMIRKAGVDPRQFTFIDLGCGKGRIVIAAADYPFKAIIGIESDAAVYETAKRNLDHWQETHSDPRLKLIHGDARNFEAPPGNLFIYMYSPFRGPIFEQVAERLGDLAGEPGRAVVIAYSADWEADILERTGRFVRIPMRRRQFWAPSTVSFFYNAPADRMRRSNHQGVFRPST